MELLRIGSRTVALGLFWQPREAKGLKVEARELALQMASGADAREFNFVALRPPNQEYGLAESPAGGLPGKVLALAGVLADKVSGKWAGHYALKTGRHWVVCIIDGQILADGDVVLNDAESARALLAQWQSNYSGLKVERHEAPQEALTLLSQWVLKARGPALVPLFGSQLASGGTGRMVLMAAVALPVTVGITWLLWPTPRQTPAAAFQVPTATNATLNRTVSVKSLPAAPPAAPEPSVAPDALGAACVQRYLQEPVSISGWWTSEWTCQAEGAVRITWRRGADGSFLQPPAGAQLDTADPDKATQSQSLGLPTAVPIAVAQRAHAAASLYELARVFGLQLNVSWPSTPRTPPGVEVPGQPAAPPPFDTSAFHLTAPAESGAPEPELLAAMANVPGLALHTMSWHETARDWNFEGVVYTGRPAAQ